MRLGKLKKVKELRNVWEVEPKFTDWLAEEENLNLLSDEIGIDMELISTEAKTGSFSTDILAVETNTNNKIIIENQLEQTNHDHLGKIITYASGHDAKTIIWIVSGARDEHRQAIDWLNEHTDEEIKIFLCNIELWKINDSAIAPKFQIVSSPNDWSKTVKRSSNNEMTSTKMLQIDYWTEVKNEIDNNDDYKFNSRKPYGQNFYNIAIRSSLANISLNISTQKSEIKVQLWISDSKELFDYLYGFKDEIESELGYELDWNRLDNYKASIIEITKNSDISNHANWDESIKWQLNKASEFYEVFPERVKSFK